MDELLRRLLLGFGELDRLFSVDLNPNLLALFHLLVGAGIEAEWAAWFLWRLLGSLLMFGR